MTMLFVGFLLSMILCILFGVPFIDFLKKKMIGQYIKELAPEAHAKKQGTPTMGGVFIVAAIIFSSIVTLFLAEKFSTTSIIILMTLLFYFFVGFQDDYIKIKGHGNDGLSARGKLLRQIAIGVLPVAYMMMMNPHATELQVGHLTLELGWFYPIFAVFVITGASNAYNLTDGLDGLASFTGVFAFAACSIICWVKGAYQEAIISATVVGALAGFLKYNKPKAQVFMGDTGSLALGGLLGVIAVMGKFELLLVIIGGVFVIETLSVMIQVASFKLTGKRVFKMAPIHHHFELCGWSEKKIVLVFGLTSAVLSVIAFLIHWSLYGIK